MLSSHQLLDDVHHDGLSSPRTGDSSEQATNATSTLHESGADSRTRPKSPSGELVFEHMVQFYDNQDHILNVLTNFVVPILSSADAVVVIATKERLDLLNLRLHDRGVSVEAATTKGQLVMINAHDLLDRAKCSGDAPPVSLEHVGALLRELNDKYPKTYVYGELVNILCSWGKHRSAIQLEEMWNDLMKHHKFTLLCGYDTNNFSSPESEGNFEQVCCRHSRMDYSSSRGLSNQDIMISMLKHKATMLEMEIERRKSTECTLQRYLELLSVRAEESLRHQQELYCTLLSVLPVGVYSAPMAHDPDGVFVNRRFCELSGATEQRLKSDGWSHAVHIDDRDCVRHLWDSSHRAFGGKHEYRYVHSDNTIRWVTGETVPFVSRGGHAHTYVHTIVDITELKELEKQREIASRKAEELLRHRVNQVERHRLEQDQFIDTLCHELRNPLSSIHGNVELLRMGLDLRESVLASDGLDLDDLERLREQSQWDQESLSAIEKCLAHQKVITDDVLNLSKLEVGKVVLRKVDFNPKATIMDTTKMFEAEANQKGVTLRFNLPVSDVIVNGDPDRVSQVLINLLANALKFTPHGTITLGMDIAERSGGRILIKISVKDDGVGLTQQEKAKLFHRFMQPTSTSYDEPGGFGLGLVISKGLVELMGGTMTVESTKGFGSEFTFTLFTEEVVHPRTVHLPACPTVPKKRKTHRIRKILVVEDNLLNQRFLVRLLEIAGFLCSTAQNGVEALICLEQREFDLILMDVHMPIMDGIASTREIRSREARSGQLPIPIIGLSGNAREEHKHEALRSGMSYYLTKPCKKDELYALIEKFDDEVGSSLHLQQPGVSRGMLA